MVVERFRDEVGDWRLCAAVAVRRPGARAVGDGGDRPRRALTGKEAHAIWSDDGIALHLPEADTAPSADLMLIDPDEVEDLVVRAGQHRPVRGGFRQNAAPPC